jgi:hypothetical protein
VQLLWLYGYIYKTATTTTKIGNNKSLPVGLSLWQTETSTEAIYVGVWSLLSYRRHILKEKNYIEGAKKIEGHPN